MAGRARRQGRSSVIHTVPTELDGERLDRAVAVLAGISRSLARSIVDAGDVRLGGSPAGGAKSRVSAGDVLEFEVPETDDVLEPHPVDYGTVYVDDHLLVVDKPSGLTVHPGAGADVDTLAAGLLFDHPSIEGVGQSGRWGIVHRLDRATSGLLVVALTTEAYEALSTMMRARQVARSYAAIVAGVLSIPRGTVDAPIGPDPNRPTKRALSPYGKHAVTHYRLKSAWPDADVSMLDVTLETGRTHQIRVHLAGIGHPVVADRVYGGRSTIEIPGRAEPLQVPRLGLHAARLELEHPVTGEPMTFTSDLPDDLADVVARLDDEVPATGS